ncbi:MAG: glycolate oxidase subunit GlcE [Lysobacterales bacterium]|nr:MAG: glycolate oxidase subunit GlcE [Xanthomonadales bacterium]
MDADVTPQLVERARAASAEGTPLRIVGGDTRRFYGRDVAGDAFPTREHAGILRHDPAELVLTARGGTSLTEVEAVLAGRGQRLPFDPPRFGAGTTLGGAVASGLAGPARAWAGPVRDYVLGVRLLTGDGRVLRFGGEVMKNVAGYDVARVMAGSLGILGVLLEVSLKVLPRPAAERTLVLDVSEHEALERLGGLSSSTLPLSASAWSAGRLHLRFEGSEATLDEIERRIGGEVDEHAVEFWTAVRDHTGAALAGTGPLWRCTLPPLSPALPMGTPLLVEWNGQQRWYRPAPGVDVQAVAAAVGGHATAFRRDAGTTDAFAPLPPAVLRLHRELKRVFDPAGVLNPGRMYAGL